MIRFDEAVGEAVRVLEERLADSSKDVTLVRDSTGMLSVVLNDAALARGQWEAVASALHEALSPWSPGSEQVLLRESDLINPDDILRSPDRVHLPEPQQPRVFLVDRLLTNQDWLRAPLVTTPPIPLLTAFSIKGGVGRSTATAVLAWHLARQGRRVVVVDLDLEAPGIASLLLIDLPSYGLIDWLVDALAEHPSDSLDDLLAVSPVGDDSPGSVRVLPAFGTETREYVAKLGRVFMPTANAEGQIQGIAHRLNALVARIAKQREPPDAVLIDSRAGLHDIGAAAVTQMGAQVFLFARDDRQTWGAYRQLLQHIRLSRGVRWGMPDEDLRWRMKMVAAQVDTTVSELSRATEASFETWQELYDDEPEEPASGAPQIFDRDEQEAPHHPVPIYFDGRVKGWQLLEKDQRPPWSVVEAAFGAFLEEATTRLDASSSDEAEEGAS